MSTLTLGDVTSARKALLSGEINFHASFVLTTKDMVDPNDAGVMKK